MKILHITAHLGGGVGSFLSELVKQECGSEDYVHEIIMLEKPLKPLFTQICERYNVKVHICPEKCEIEKIMQESDITVLHWWHHPQTEKLLGDFVKCKIRLMIWFHVNGCNYPYIPFKLCENAHYLAFTTPYAYDNPFWTQSEKELVLEKSAVIYGMGNVELLPQAKKHINKKDFTIGYVGTISKSKINPNFAEFCAKTLEHIPNARFVMLGDKTDCDVLIGKLKALNIYDSFEFVGYVNNVDEYLHSFDAFGYPLNPTHFGATENTILQAMSVGLPVVLLNQNTEKYIVTNMHDGLLVDDASQYANAMKNLYDSAELRSKLGENARITVLEKYNIKRNVEKTHNALNYVFNQTAKQFSFADIFGSTAFEQMISCTGEDKEIFVKAINASPDESKEILRNCKDIYRGTSKSSPFQFLETSKEDANLIKICNALGKENDGSKFL